MASQWDPTPWMIGGGVKHSLAVTRLLAYLAANGEEGIAKSTDLFVRAMATPGSLVRVAPGACAITNRNSGVSYDAYAARLPAEDQVTISATGSSSWRTDLVVVRVENPFLAGEPYTPPSQSEIDGGTARFIQTYVYSGILSGSGSPVHPTTAQIAARIGNESALPLASIAVPVSTSAITQAMIKDQRKSLFVGRSQADSYVIRTAANGRATIPFPREFAAGRVIVTCTGGNGENLWVIPDPTLTGFTVEARYMSNNALCASVNIRVNYQATLV